MDFVFHTKEEEKKEKKTFSITEDINLIRQRVEQWKLEEQRQEQQRQTEQKKLQEDIQQNEARKLEMQRELQETEKQQKQIQQEFEKQSQSKVEQCEARDQKLALSMEQAQKNEIQKQLAELETEIRSQKGRLVESELLSLRHQNKVMKENEGKGNSPIEILRKIALAEEKMETVESDVTKSFFKLPKSDTGILPVKENQKLVDQALSSADSEIAKYSPKEPKSNPGLLSDDEIQKLPKAALTPVTSETSPAVEMEVQPNPEVPQTDTIFSAKWKEQDQRFMILSPSSEPRLPLASLNEKHVIAVPKKFLVDLMKMVAMDEKRFLNDCCQEEWEKFKKRFWNKTTTHSDLPRARIAFIEKVRPQLEEFNSNLCRSIAIEAVLHSLNLTEDEIPKEVLPSLKYQANNLYKDVFKNEKDKDAAFLQAGFLINYELVKLATEKFQAANSSSQEPAPNVSYSLMCLQNICFLTSFFYCRMMKTVPMMKCLF